MGQRVTDSLRNLLIDMTALAALGTIADVVPLVGENRVIASFGLTCLPKSKLAGIQAIIASANLDGEKLDAYHVGFLIAPRLNAAGRMGHAALAVEMLTTAPPDRAAEIAVYLEQQNRQRQTTEKQTLEHVLSEISRLGDDRDDCHAVLLAGKGWHPGVIGIVASRVVDRLHKPAVLISLPEDSTEEAAGGGQSGTHGAGSGRSIPGFHLARAFQHCSDLLLSHGGHEMAAGLKVLPAHIPELRNRFQTYARQTLAPELLTPELKLDCEAGLGQLTAALVSELSRLGPFGHGNRKPLLACRGVEVALAPRRVGKTGDHIQLTLRHNGATLKGIAFNKGDWADHLRPGQKIDIAVEPVLNEWNGRVSVEVQVKDIRPA
jgi:single-stranded-DNA-specific exonuclease